MKKQHQGFIIAGAIMTILFLIIINYLTSPDYVWSIYPMFAIIFLTGCTFAIINRNKAMSWAGSLIIISFLVYIHHITAPRHPWFLYAIFPILWYMAVQIVPHSKYSIKFAIIGSFIWTIYYIGLNIFISPWYPWSIYTTFVFIWWPIITYFSSHKKPFTFSVISAVIVSVFAIVSNCTTTPNTIWAIYPIFVVLWWPLSVYYFKCSNN